MGNSYESAVFDLRKQGISYGEIAKQLGLTKGQVAGCVQRGGLSTAMRPDLRAAISNGRRATGPAHDPTMIKLARQMWDQGRLTRHICEMIGVSEPTFAEMRRRNHFSPRGITREKKVKVPRPPRVRTNGVTPKALPAEPVEKLRRYAVIATFTEGRRCVYPSGDCGTASFRWCDAVVTTPGPYCDECRKLAYRQRAVAA